MKEALSAREYRFLRRIYQDRQVTDRIGRQKAFEEGGRTIGYSGCGELIRDLEASQVFDTSPDDLFIRLTDLGLDLFRAMLHRDSAWHKNASIVRVATFSRDEATIPAGNLFVGQRWIKEILSGASSSLDICDTYIGPELFDRINDADVRVDIRVLTQKCGGSPSYYTAFKQGYQGKIELRNAKPGVLHARTLIVDQKSGYTIDHSLKDLGKKDAHIKKIANIASELALFEKRWSEATAVA